MKKYARCISRSFRETMSSYDILQSLMYMVKISMKSNLKLWIINTTDAVQSASYLWILLKTDKWWLLIVNLITCVKKNTMTISGPNCERSISMYQHLSNACIQTMYLQVVSTFQKEGRTKPEGHSGIVRPSFRNIETTWRYKLCMQALLLKMLIHRNKCMSYS